MACEIRYPNAAQVLTLRAKAATVLKDALRAWGVGILTQ